MALHSNTAFASLDVGSLCKLRGSNLSHIQSSAFLKPREGLLALNRFSLRKANHFHQHGHHLHNVMAMAEATATSISARVTLDGDQCYEIRKQMMQENIEKQPFKIQELEEGGKKDWHPATVLAVQELAPGVRNITVEVECSREMVALDYAYSAPGRLAQVKVNGGEVFKVAASCPPFSMKVNESVLYKVRGDIPAGMTKQPQYFLSVKAPLDLLVFESETPKVFPLKEGDQLEIGPFDLSGLDLRPILFLSRFPTILFFASGKGIAIAKAIIETKDADVGSLSLSMRDDIRLFYWSSEPSKVLYKDCFKKWENQNLKVRTAVGELSGQDWDGHVGSFTSLWDEDDIEYDPESTGVVVCVDPELREEVHELLSDAGISEKQVLRWEP